MPDPTDQFDNWADVMSALESASLAAADTALTADDAARVAWVAPTGLGPLPDHLRARAGHLLNGQRASIGHLEELRRETGRHLAAVRSVPPAQPDGQSVYLDVTG